MTRQARPVPVTGAEHPLRRVRLRRGLTQVELAGLAGLAPSCISMIERGRRKLTRRDHVNALAAALKVPSAEIAPSMIAGSGEWAPAPPPGAVGGYHARPVPPDGRTLRPGTACSAVVS